ncbi:MAG: bifunctional hydroxymethylpyrimidine kinase/phosphomethylpyrimidine kinase, partial [Thiohalorhabdaceae bacterium]
RSSEGSSTSSWTARARRDFDDYTPSDADSDLPVAPETFQRFERLEERHDESCHPRYEPSDELLREGAHYVLLKGGHSDPEADIVTDRLFSFGQEEATFSHPRLPDRGYHGSGCTLSTAIACGLADGREMIDSVRTGIDFNFRALQAAYTPGRGQAVPNRMFHWRGWEE